MELLRDDTSWCAGSRIEMAGGVYEGDIVGRFVGEVWEDVAEEVVCGRNTWDIVSRHKIEESVDAYQHNFHRARRQSSVYCRQPSRP